MAHNLQYIQIAGNFKTGTTLLSSLFDNLPEIAAFPHETGNTGYLFPALNNPQITKQEKVKLLANRWLAAWSKAGTNGKAKNLAFDYQKMAKLFLEKAQTIPNHFPDIHYACLENFYDIFNPAHLQKAKIWLDKSPLSHLFADQIFNYFPQAKYLHILRDPKDNFASMAVKFIQQKRGRLETEALLWRYRIWSAQSFYFAKRNQQKFNKENYLVIRFEDLCANPQKIVPQLCRFINIPETDDVYRPTLTGQSYKGNNWEGQKFNGISSANVGRWAERIPAYYAKVMEAQPQNILQHFNYQPHFSQKARQKALARHKLLTLLMPKSYKLTKGQFGHPSLFRSPAPSIPGI